MAVSHAVTLIAILIFVRFTTVMAMPDPPNTHKGWDKLEGITVWDTIPSHGFLDTWFVSLQVALGAIIQDGYTLLQCALRDDDPTGSAAGTAAGTAAASAIAAAVVAHRLRSSRLAACIQKYLKPGTELMRRIREHSPHDGVRCFEVVKRAGQLKQPLWKSLELKQDFEKVTMKSAGIPIKDDSIFRWIAYLRDLVAKMDKAERPTEKRIFQQFLDGFPVGFETALILARGNVSSNMKHEATYPADHPLAGDPNPLAGEPSMERATEELFYAEWSRRVAKGLIKNQHDSVRQTDEADDDESPDDEDANAAQLRAFKTALERAEKVGDDEGVWDLIEQMNAWRMMTSRPIGPDDVCGACGGRGHFAVSNGKKCLTIVLGNTIPKDELMQTIYPRNLKYPDFSRGPKSKFQRKDSASASTSSINERRKPSNSPKSPKGKKPFVAKGKGKGKARVADSNNEPFNEVHEDEASSESEASESEEVKMINSLAVDYGHIVVTPPPSPPYDTPSSPSYGSYEPSDYEAYGSYEPSDYEPSDEEAASATTQPAAGPSSNEPGPSSSEPGPSSSSEHTPSPQLLCNRESGMPPSPRVYLWCCCWRGCANERVPGSQYCADCGRQCRCNERYCCMLTEPRCMPPSNGTRGKDVVGL